MEIRAALAGNPNCGKTTMFNALTGANQYVGNWPGVTVEKKEGKVRTKESKEEKIKVTDLPGVYSLSPYTLEEVVSRDYILNEDPDVIINLVDATNIERNLYLTTQLTETGVPVVIALNMADLIRKRGMKIDKKRLSELLNCPVIETSALKKTGLKELIEETVCTVKSGEKSIPKAIFSKELEAAIRAVEELLPTWIDERKKRWYAVKLLENDRKVLENLKMSGESLKAIEKMRKAMEEKHDDDMESIVTDETVCLLSKLNVKHHIEVELHMDELDLTAAESKATYEEIKSYVLEHTGLKVSNLYIAQIKQKCGIIERVNYNLPKSENSRQPKCPPEKEVAIREALEHFRMI